MWPILTAHQPVSLCYSSLQGTRQGDTTKTRSPQRRHMSAVFWGLVSSQKVLMELCFGICTCRRCCSRDRERRGRGEGGHGGETSLSVKQLKGDMASVERRAASLPLSSPVDTHRCKLTSSAPLPQMLSVSAGAGDRPGFWVIEPPFAYSAPHIFI